MSWPSQLTPFQLFIFKGDWVSFLHQDPIANPLASICTSNGFVKSKNHNTDVDDNFPFKNSNAFCYSPFPLNDPPFLKRSMNGFIDAKMSFMNFL
jgi:hypothetical protein